MTRIFPSATLVLLACTSLTVQAAENLEQVFDLASNNDPVIREARARYDANHTLLADGRAGLLPTLTLTGNSARNTQAPTSEHSFASGFNTHSYSLSLSQNLVNFESWYSYQSARQNDRQVVQQLAIAEQDLILRVATAYFDVLRSQNNLELFQAEEEAALQVMQQAQERYDLGFAEISDVFDSRTGHSQARVNRLEEENLLRQRLQTLSILTGRSHEELLDLSEDFQITAAEPDSLPEWIAVAEQNNLDIKAAEFTLAATEYEAKAAKAAMLPTLTLNANYNDTAERENPFAFISEASNNTAIGVSLSIPLLRGGSNRSRMRRAYYTIDADREVLERVTRESLATITTSFRNIETSLLTLEARQETIALAESALEATEVGMEVGTRNVVDLVQSQRALFQTLRDYSNARYDYVLDTLTLKQAAGTLSPQDVIDLNIWLE